MTKHSNTSLEFVALCQFGVKGLHQKVPDSLPSSGYNNVVRNTNHYIHTSFSTFTTAFVPFERRSFARKPFQILHCLACFAHSSDKLLLVTHQL